MDTSATTQDTMHRIDMGLDKGGARNTSVVPMDKREDYYNFYLGHIPEGREQVPLYDRLIYPDVFEDIDLMLASNGAGAKYYFICKPGSDPDDIELNFSGQSSLSTSSGDLIIATSLEDIVLPEPTAYQIDSNGDTVQVSWIPAYSINSGKVTITSGTYNSSQELVFQINRDVSSTASADDWVTYLGDVGADLGMAITTDNNGVDENVYTAGHTNSPDFPIIDDMSIYPDIQGKDFYIIKFDVLAVPQWATYYGGSSGEEPTDIALNSKGDIYVLGNTNSDDFPVFPPNTSSLLGSEAGVVVKLENDGSAANWSRYISGTNRELAVGLDVGDNDNVYIVGWTASSTFSLIMDKTGAYNQSGLRGITDGFLLEFNESNVQLWGTYFGGAGNATVGGGNESLGDVEVGDRIYVLGQTDTQFGANQTSPCGVPTNSELFPNCDPGGSSYTQPWGGNNGVQVVDMFVAEFDLSGVLKWSTYLGGKASETVIGNPFGAFRREGKIATSLTSPTTIAVVGYSLNGSLFPHVDYTNGFNQSINELSPIIAKFENRDLVWSTSFACSHVDPSFAQIAKGLAFGKNDNLYLSGYTDCNSIPDPSDYCDVPPSADFPICPPPDADVFFQDDDVTDNQIGTPQHNGGQYEVYIASFDSDNQLVWSTFFGGNSFDEVNDLHYGAVKDRIYLTGFTKSSSSFPVLDPGSGAYFEPNHFNPLNNDAFIARLGIEGVPVVSTYDIKNSSVNQIDVFPNPSNGITYAYLEIAKGVNVNVIIFDVTGRLITQFNRNVGEDNLIKLDLSSFSKGMYFAQVTVDDKIFISKLTIQ